jgi:predicted dehydrogenase
VEPASDNGRNAHPTGEAAPLRIGVVGAGLIAQLAGIADPSPAARTALSARYGVPAVADHRALLDAGDLDAVVVCSPNGTHAAVTLDALDAGLHVLVEKPLCITLADADRIAAAARERGRVVQVGYMKRYEPAYEALLDLLAARPRLRHLVTTTIDPGLPAAFAPAGFVPATGVPSPVADAVRRGTAEQVAEAVDTDAPEAVAAFSDVFLGALVHDVNLVHGLLADERRARVHDAAGDAVSASALVELGDGARWAMAWLLEPSAGAFSEELVACTGAGLHRLTFPAPYQRPSAATHQHTAATAPGTWRTRTTSGYADAYVRQLEHFHACVTTGAPCRTPAADARRDLELLTAIFARVCAAGIPA